MGVINWGDGWEPNEYEVNILRFSPVRCDWFSKENKQSKYEVYYL
jgi:hypothetical protein